MRALFPAFVLIAATLRAEAPAQLNWETRWEDAFARARAEKKMVLVDFWASWCRPCVAMDRETFPDKEVMRRLGDFVVLKLDIDKDKGRTRQERVSAFPSYGFYDPWERRRFYFIGFHTAKGFSEKLDLIRASNALIIQAGQSLTDGKEAESYLILGNAYLRARDTVDAREAYEKAKKRAVKDGNAELAQVASIQSAFTLAVEGKAEKALKLLAKEGEKPVNPACEASRLMAVGHIHRMKGHKTAAAEAYRQAINACAHDAVIKKEAELALASLD